MKEADTIFKTAEVYMIDWVWLMEESHIFVKTDRDTRHGRVDRKEPPFRAGCRGERVSRGIPLHGADALALEINKRFPAVIDAFPVAGGCLPGRTNTPRRAGKRRSRVKRFISG